MYLLLERPKPRVKGLVGIDDNLKFSIRKFADDAGASRDAGASDGGGAAGDPDAPGYLAGEDDIIEDGGDDGGCALGTGKTLPFTPLLGAVAMMLVGMIRRRAS